MEHLKEGMRSTGYQNTGEMLCLEHDLENGSYGLSDELLWMR
jgi:hypothetical protein